MYVNIKIYVSHGILISGLGMKWVLKVFHCCLFVITVAHYVYDKTFSAYFVGQLSLSKFF